MQDPRSAASGRGVVGIILVVVLALVAFGCGEEDDDGGDAQETTTEAAAEPAPPPFSYSGATGPANWGSISPDYATCADGKSQSPVDLNGGKPSDGPSLEVAYEPDEVEVENNGHSVEGIFPEGSSITLDGKEYPLDSLHFHAPSEHPPNGRSYPIEFHFVNATPAEERAVLGVFVEEGAENPAVAKLVKALPEKEGETATVEGLNPAEILPVDPASADRWSYDGSLTTPPCTEGVRWTVFNEPIQMSAEQIAAFTAIYDDTNRPTQPLNGRKVLLVTD